MLRIDNTHQHAGCRRVPRRPGTIAVDTITVTTAGHSVEVRRDGKLVDLGALPGTLYDWVGLAGDDDRTIYTGCLFVPAPS